MTDKPKTKIQDYSGYEIFVDNLGRFRAYIKETEHVTASSLTSIKAKIDKIAAHPLIGTEVFQISEFFAGHSKRTYYIQMGKIVAVASKHTRYGGKEDVVTIEFIDHKKKRSNTILKGWRLSSCHVYWKTPAAIKKAAEIIDLKHKAEAFESKAERMEEKLERFKLPEEEKEDEG